MFMPNISRMECRRDGVGKLGADGLRSGFRAARPGWRFAAHDLENRSMLSPNGLSLHGPSYRTCLHIGD
jgi:hypothetical protein